MKNQYFGDVNDFYKYDLALSMMKACGLRTFTFLAMLTPDDERTDGQLTRYGCGNRSQALHQFLQQCVAEDRRSVREIKRLLERHRIPNVLLEKNIAKMVRWQYFASVGPEELESALVFLDPDNGFEVDSTRPGNVHKYVRYAEVRDLMKRMAEDSVLMVYQHFPRVDRASFLAQIAQRLRERVAPLGCACYSPDNQVAFFFLSKGHSQRTRVQRVLPLYASRVGAAHCAVDLI